MASFRLAAAFALLAATALWAEDSEPGEWIAPEVREFGNWSVACDNVHDCTAVSVSREFAERSEEGDHGDYAEPKLWVTRRAGPGERVRVFVDTAVWGEGGATGALTLHVYYSCPDDCTGPAYRLKPLGKGRYELAPEQVAAFFAESVKTSLAATRRGDGSIHGLASTGGLVSAMRFIDESQQRRDTVTAIYAKGKKPASAVPAQRARPVVPLVWGVAEPSTEMPAHSEVTRIRAEHCPGPHDVPETNIQRFRLRNGQNLWSVICAATPQNPTHLWLIETARGKFELFKLPRPEQGRAAELPILPNTRFDPASGRLTGYFTDKNVRSCGWKRQWGWTGSAFVMIEATEMPTCLDILPQKWLQTYRALTN